MRISERRARSHRHQHRLARVVVRLVGVVAGDGHRDRGVAAVVLEHAGAHRVAEDAGIEADGGSPDAVGNQAEDLTLERDGRPHLRRGRRERTGVVDPLVQLRRRHDLPISNTTRRPTLSAMIGTWIVAVKRLYPPASTVPCELKTTVMPLRVWLYVMSGVGPSNAHAFEDRPTNPRRSIHANRFINDFLSFCGVTTCFTAPEPSRPATSPERPASGQAALKPDASQYPMPER